MGKLLYLKADAGWQSWRKQHRILSSNTLKWCERWGRPVDTLGHLGGPGAALGDPLGLFTVIKGLWGSRSSLQLTSEK